MNYNKIVQRYFRFFHMKHLFSPCVISILTLSFFHPAFTAAAQGDSESKTSDNDTHYTAIIKIDSEDAVNALLEEGVDILRRRDNLLLCFIPITSVNPSQRSPAAEKSSPDAKRNARTRQLNEIKGVSKIERGRKITKSMDKAREWFNAEYLHSGNELPGPYTGAGVVTGICDIGLDPLHIAFMDTTGEPRIKRVIQYKEGSGERIVLESKKDYEEWKTDTPDNWHATHVANIMAGSYGPYRGMAPDSDMVISTSQLTDVGLLCGAEDILEYAVEMGKRAVINMSMANYIGPHDGSSLFCQYLDKVGEEAVVVLSAGNGGRTLFTLPFDFTENNNSAAMPLYSSDWVQFNPYGAVDVWSIDDSPLRVRFGIQDSQEVKIVKMFPWQELYNDCRFTVTSDPDLKPISEKETVIYDEDFAYVYSGWMSLTGGIDSENGRFRMLMEYDAHTGHVASQGPWARYVPVIEVAGSPGTHADIYADFQYTNFRSLPGGVQPTSLLSFSDLATGENVISVGMFVNRDRRPSIYGEDFTNDVTPGTVFEGSSYSTLNDGRVMPHTVAPGFGVVSAMSNPFNEAHPDANEQINAEATVNGKRYLWATNYGTSMSSPYVAGTIACWLEALPDLTPRQIMSIIAESNRHDYPDQNNPRHGQGWFDPLRGLKIALESYSGIDNINGVSSDNDNYSDKRRLSFSGSTLQLWNPEGKESRVIVSDSSGLTLFTETSSSSVDEFHLSSLPRGLYIAYIPSSQARIKFVLK